MSNPFFLFLRTIIFYFGYIATLFPHSCLCVLFGWLLPIKLRFKYFVLWNHFAVWWLKITCGVKYEITGDENIPDQPFVLLSNHQSPWETLFLYYYFQPLTATLKKQLLIIPFFGWALALLRPIAIDRNKKRGARQMLLSQGNQRLKDGLSVLVFPEGTRTEPGKTKKYSSGGASLAISSNALILPVAHNSGDFWPAHRFLKFPGVIKVTVGKPIITDNLNPRELSEQVETWTHQTLYNKGS